VRLLIDRGADVTDRSPDGMTALGCAAQAGNRQSVLALVGAGADVNAASCGRSPLSIASLFGNHGAALALIECGADVNARDPRDGCTPMMNAVVANSDSVVEILLAAGAEPGPDSEADDGNGNGEGEGLSPLRPALRSVDAPMAAVTWQER
jgi:ankyrin repeat protein